MVDKSEIPASLVQRAYSQIKSAMLTGVLVVTPISIILFLIIRLIGFADGIIGWLPVAWQPKTIVGFDIPGIGILITGFVIYLVGIAMRYYVGRQIVLFYESILQRVPVFNSLYQATKQLMSTIFTAKGTHFREVVLVEYPRRDIYSFAFLTNKEKYISIEERNLISIFLPSTPNPTTGFYLLVPVEDLYRINMGVEEAFKLIMSAGIVTPEMIRTAVPFQPPVSEGSNPASANEENESRPTMM